MRARAAARSSACGAVELSRTSRACAWSRSGPQSSPRRCSSATSSRLPRTSRAAPPSARSIARPRGTTARSRRRSSSPRGSTRSPSSPALDAVYRSYAWVTPLEAGTVRAWAIDRLAGDAARARSALQTDLERVRAHGAARGAARRGGGERRGRRGGSCSWEASPQRFSLPSPSSPPSACAATPTPPGGGSPGSGRDAGSSRSSRAWRPPSSPWAGPSQAGRSERSPERPLPRERGRRWARSSAHSTLSRTGVIAAGAVALALTLVLLAALRAKPLALGRRSFSALDAAALGALAVVVLTLLRGDLDQEALAAESGTSVALVLLPGLVTFVAAVACARLLRPSFFSSSARPGAGRCPSGSQRSPWRAIPAMPPSRRPSSSSASASRCSRRATAPRSPAGRRSRQPSPSRSTSRSGRTSPISSRCRRRPRRSSSQPWARASRSSPCCGSRATSAARAGEPASPCSASTHRAIPTLKGWRDDFASLSQQALAARIEPAGNAATRGPVLPEDATARRVAGAGVRQSC